MSTLWFLAALALDDRTLPTPGENPGETGSFLPGIPDNLLILVVSIGALLAVPTLKVAVLLLREFKFWLREHL
ncbi:hypothetical protein [Tunturiibacter gelidoferens]|uniref:Uncharacterized protein n=3 Tax=Tunturiibacter TaxID=3154218 RepID=A0A7Y9NNT5_9BACT|nr:hypothetical protein [Edaphobacter lichenicola]MBB5338027.1 hypothetical protein [Edaphobacter lichenicola]NYF52746.1 hypothetical protein [Edaphobacter lichenicola]